MGHLYNVKEEYLNLQRRIDQSQVGLPASQEAYEILKVLFTEDEARLAAVMPLRPSPVSAIAKKTGRAEKEVESLLDRMAKKGLVIDMYNEQKRQWYYAVAPPVVGFFEFSMIRKREDIDQKKLAGLFHAYMSDSMEFARRVFGGDTQIGRTVVHETALPEGSGTDVLSYELAGDLIRDSKGGAVALCYCRHESMHLGKPCSHPMEICTSLNGGADYILRHGHGRKATVEELLDILARAREEGLVQICDNVQNRPTYICHCCACCCGQLRAINQHGLAHAVKTSMYQAASDESKCVGCGKCARACPIQAVTMTAVRPEPGKKQTIHARVDAEICIGCGVCADKCAKDAMRMERRGERVLTPVGTVERILRMSLERGNLQHLLFDDQAGPSSRFLNLFCGALLRLPPVKRAMAKEQVKSRFINFFIDGIKRTEGESAVNF